MRLQRRLSPRNLQYKFCLDEPGDNSKKNSGETDKKGNVFTVELAKNSLDAPEDGKSKEGERKSETDEKPDVEVEDHDDEEEDENASGSGKIEFGSADLTENDKDESVR